MTPPLDVSALLAQQEWAERLAGGLVRDSSLAADIAQEAWLRATLRATPTPPDEPGALRGFLAGVVKNLVRSTRRADGRRARREVAAARPEALPSADELVSRAELQRLLVESVLALDEHERTAVLLRYFEGLSAEEIARRSDVPAGTIRARLSRGLERLRARLEQRIDRRDLLAGLVALSGLPPAVPLPTSPVRPPELGWIGGLLAMKTSTTLAASAALLAFVAGAWLLTRGEERSRATPSVEPAELAAAPLAPASLDAPLAHVEAAETARTVVETPHAAVPEPVAAPVEPAKARVVARVVDPEGRGVEGVTLLVDEKPAGASGAQGRIDLEIAPRGQEELVFVELRHAGFARAMRAARLAAGREVHLGDIQLARAATLRGHVEDERGARLAGVRLLTTALENERTDPEELRRLGPLSQESSVLAASGPDGAFELAGVPLGAVRLWGGDDAHAWGALGPLDVPREGLDDLVLVVHALDPLDRIGGRVLSPEGQPVPEAQVHTWFMATNFGTGSTYATDALGAFDFLLQQRVAHDLTISDPKNRWSELYLPAVEPGKHDLELRFEAPRWIEVTVRDPEGRPVPDFTLALERAVEGNGLRMDAKVEPLGEGRARLRAPNARFSVTADASGREHVVRGPFDPLAPPEMLELELPALAGVRGVVLTSTGEPAAGASVGLYRTVGGNVVIEKNGFRLKTEAWTQAKTKTDGDGRFVLYPPIERASAYVSGLLVLRASADGHAATELAPRAYDARAGEDVELRLVHGGAIEGSAIVAPGVDPTGFLVGFHRGDGEIRTQRLGPDGRYRVERLTPGEWEVRALDEELHGNRSSSSSTVYEDGAPPYTGWNCTVVDGETTHFDADFSDHAPCRIVGELALAGRDLDGWTASLELRRLVDDVVLAAVPLDARGRFELVAPRGGPHRLVLRGPEDASGRLELREELDLAPGERAWSLALAPGRLEGSGALGRGTRERFYSYDWQGTASGHALTAKIRLVPGSDGRFVLPTVPDGRGKISRNDPQDSAQDFAPWEVVAEFELAPGGTRQVALP